MLNTVLCSILLLFISNNNIILSSDYSNEFLISMRDSDEQPIKETVLPVKIKEKSGSEIILKCRHECHKTNTSRWEFAQCKYCYKRKQFVWITVQKNRKKPCSTDLALNNVTYLNNGLFRCILNNSTVISNYEVVVYDEPKILDVDLKYLHPHQKVTGVVIKCTISSREIPSIWWLREVDNGTKYDFKYLDKYYTRINTTLHDYSIHDDNIYISKLKLSNVTYLDNGVYVCVAITEQEKDFKEFRINVLQYFGAKDEQSNPRLLLFLIPLPFIIIPICIWLCYFKKKNATRKKDVHNQQKSILLQTKS